MSSISTCPYEVFQVQILGLTTAKGSLLNPWHVAGGPRLPLAGNHVPGLLRVARSQPAALLTTAQLGGFHLLPTATAIWVLEQKYALKMPVSHPDCVLDSHCGWFSTEGHVLYVSPLHIEVSGRSLSRQHLGVICAQPANESPLWISLVIQWLSLPTNAGDASSVPSPGRSHIPWSS